jgi:hypothetical protein
MHYNHLTGQPCNCTFHKPYPGEPEYVEETSVTSPELLWEQPREVVGNLFVEIENDDNS